MGGVGKLSASDSLILLASEAGDSLKDIALIIGVLVAGWAGSSEDVSGVLGPLFPSQLFPGFIMGVVVPGGKGSLTSGVWVGSVSFSTHGSCMNLVNVLGWIGVERKSGSEILKRANQ